MIKAKWVIISILFLIVTTNVQAASTVHKPADLGPTWRPIGSSGTYVYTDSFIAPENGVPTSLGTYLRLYSGEIVPNIRFEVWGDNSGPDAGNVIASTGSLSLAVDSALTFFSAPVVSQNGSMSEGGIYWFAATVVGEDVEIGEYQVGGHTQNSVYVDNGTFWYSNDPAGINFDGQNLTPEMAFEVQVSGGTTSKPIPSLSEWGMIIMSLILAGSAIWTIRRRQVS